jgi:SAM-dependent methyltransferase
MASTTMRYAFTDIYSQHRWGSRSLSGPGSLPEMNRPYQALLEHFIRTRRIESVVDLGCGDWAFSRSIDWGEAGYTAIDVVPELIDKLNSQYSRPGVRFVCGDLVNLDIPGGDLAILKDVLQHWPNASVLRLLSRLDRFKYAIITNDYRLVRNTGWHRIWRREEIGVANTDTTVGGWRPLRLRESPFSLPAVRLRMVKVPVGQVVFVKEVLLWENLNTERKAMP